MTITATNSSTGPITCSDGQTVYTFTFEADTASHVKAVHADSNGVETAWTYVTHYTVDLTAKTITYNDALGAVSAGDKVTVYRETPQTQAIEFESHGPWLPQNHEDAADKSMKVAQEAMDIANRSIQAPRTDPTKIPHTILDSGFITTPAAMFAIDLSSVTGFVRCQLDIVDLQITDGTGGKQTLMHLFTSSSGMPTASGGYQWGVRHSTGGAVSSADDTDWYTNPVSEDYETMHMRVDVYMPDTLNEWWMEGTMMYFNSQADPSSAPSVMMGYWAYRDTGAVAKPDELRFSVGGTTFASGQYRLIGLY